MHCQVSEVTPKLQETELWRDTNKQFTWRFTFSVTRCSHNRVHCDTAGNISSPTAGLPRLVLLEYSTRGFFGNRNCGETKGENDVSDQQWQCRLQRNTTSITSIRSSARLLSNPHRRLTTGKHLFPECNANLEQPSRLPRCVTLEPHHLGASRGGHLEEMLNAKAGRSYSWHMRAKQLHGALSLTINVMRQLV